MHDSVTYQAIVAEGELKRAKKDILQLGRKLLGDPGEDVQATLAAMTDLEQLDAIHERLVDVKSWDELLATS